MVPICFGKDYGKKKKRTHAIDRYITMGEKKVSRKIFIYSISIVVALVVVNMAFLAVVSLVGLFAKSEPMRYTAIIIAISVSVFCGFQCYKKIYIYLKKEVDEL